MSIRDGNPLTDMVVPTDAAGKLEFFGVDVETVDIVENALGVVDDATGSWGVAVSRRNRGHAPSEASDQVVQFGEFGGGGQVAPLG